MAQKRPGKSKSRVTATRKTKGKTKRKAARRASKTARKAAPAISLDQVSEDRQAAILRAVQRALEAEGVTGRVTELQLTADDSLAVRSAPSGRSLTRMGPATTASPPGCPEGQVRRVVCSRREDGTVVCVQRCVEV